MLGNKGRAILGHAGKTKVGQSWGMLEKQRWVDPGVCWESRGGAILGHAG